MKESNVNMDIDNMDIDELESLGVRIREKINQKYKEEKAKEVDETEQFILSKRFKELSKEYKQLCNVPKSKVVINLPITLTIDPNLDIYYETNDPNDILDDMKLNCTGETSFGNKIQKPILNRVIEEFCEDACFNIMYLFPKEVQKDLKDRAKRIVKIQKELENFDLGVLHLE